MINLNRKALYVAVLLAHFSCLQPEESKNNNQNINILSQNETQIGTQIWDRNNLNVDTFQNGDLIPEARTESEWASLNNNGKPAWCYYNNVKRNGEKYGKLYNWYAVNDSRGLAPEGWHIPSDEEWTILIERLGCEHIDGSNMGLFHRWQLVKNGNNNIGFWGLPGGYRSFSGSFHNIGKNSYWWSSSDYIDTNAWGYELYSDTVYRGYPNKKGALSVRCIKD